MNEPTGRAPDFKTACIVMFGVNITWIFFVLWAIWGLIAVASLGWCINRAITFWGARGG